MPGFCLSSAALYFVYRYIETEKLSRFFIATVTAAVSVLLKSNYLIVLVALVIYLLSEGYSGERPGSWRRLY